MIEATERQKTAANAVQKALEPNPWSRPRIDVFGADSVAENQTAYLNARPHANAENQARAEIEALRTLTPAKAVERIEQTRVTERAAREAPNVH